MKEEWKDIEGFEELYQVSNTGLVRTLNYSGQRNNTKPLKQRVNKYGYLDVRLSKLDVRKRYLVHRLVLKAFVGESDLTVNHIDKNRKNNTLDNLEYMTVRDNVTYSLGTKINVTYNDGKEKVFKSASHCAESLNCTATAILYIIKGMCDGRNIKKNNNVSNISMVGGDANA